MFNKLSLATLAVSSVLALVGPATASARDRNDYQRTSNYGYGNQNCNVRTYNNQSADQYNIRGYDHRDLNAGNEQWARSRSRNNTVRNDYDTDDQPYNSRYNSGYAQSYGYNNSYNNGYNNSYNNDSYGSRNWSSQNFRSNRAHR
jgi:hypothetical protein